MHLLESMAYVGQKPWHGPGTQLARQQPIETWKQQAGMDWKIEESEVRYITGGQLAARTLEPSVRFQGTRSSIALTPKRLWQWFRNASETAMAAAGSDVS